MILECLECNGIFNDFDDGVEYAVGLENDEYGWCSERCRQEWENKRRKIAPGASNDHTP